MGQRNRDSRTNRVPISFDKERCGYKVVFSVMEIVVILLPFVIHLHSSPYYVFLPTS